MGALDEMQRDARLFTALYVVKLQLRSRPAGAARLSIVTVAA